MSTNNGVVGVWHTVLAATALVIGLLVSSLGCARSVSRDELRRLEMEGIVETVNTWWYMGSSDGYHWLHNTRILQERNVRIKADQLVLKRTFPLTLDSDKWVRLPMGVWFSNDPRVDHDFISAPTVVPTSAPAG